MRGHGPFKSFAAAVLAAVASLPGTSALASDACPPIDYRFSISTSVPEAVYIRSEDSDRISRMMGAGALSGYVAKGVTLVGYSSGYSLSVQSDQMPDGRWCSRVADLSVAFDFKQPPEIYISRDIEPGSCFDRVVLEHENHHLSIAKGALKSGRQWIEKGLRDYVASGGEVGASADQANAMVQNRVKRIIDTVSKCTYEGADTRNRSLDTPESYKTLSEACRGG